MLRKVFMCAAICLANAVSIPGYDPAESQMFASLASVAYCDNIKAVSDWTCSACNDSKTPLVPGRIQVIDGGIENSTRVVVGKLRDQDGCLMAFRGSDNFMNWLRNLEFWQVSPTAFDENCTGCKVHSGFYGIWKNIRGAAVNALNDVGCSPDGGKDNLLYITGHSMGAGVQHLAMFTLHNAGYKIAKTYSFEAPRIGNQAFSDAFTSEFSRKFPVFRITHNMDPVPHLPPTALGYVHVQTEVYYNSSGEYKVCDAVEDSTCADQYWDVPAMLLLHNGDHCASPLLPNGDFCNPVGCAATTVVDTSVVVV